jgi:hypothetical protein
MDKLLIAGVNTRALAHSAYALGYQVYSASYFCTTDFNSYHYKKCILEQKPYHSCGTLQESYNQIELKELCSEWVDDVDYIIPYTGISPQMFPSSKVLGNKNVENVENKYKLYKSLKKKFKMPKTFLLSSIVEALEIQAQSPNKKYLIKPINGSGGYGVYNLNSKLLKDLKNNESALKDLLIPEKFILQEYILGEEVSASVISTTKESKSLISNSQIKGSDSQNNGQNFIYHGNLTPYPGDDTIIKKTAELVIDKLDLIGSNGVDMIQNPDGIHIIEVNPRFQGTFECTESSLGINLIHAHVTACNGELINPPSADKYCVKKIVYASEKSLIKILNIPGVYDIPLKNVIIEKGEPVVTVIGCSKNPIMAMSKVDHLIKKIKNMMEPVVKSNLI